MANGHGGKREGAGRKPKHFSFVEALKLELATTPDAVRIRKIADKLVRAAEGGDLQAINMVADRLDGKPKTYIAGSEDEPINVVHEVVRRVVAPKAQGE